MKSLTFASALIIASCSPVPATAIELNGNTVTLSDTDKVSLAACKTDGGCQVWTGEEIKLLVQEVARQLADKVCKKETI